LWGTGSAAFLLDETDLAVRLLQEALQRLRAPGVQGTGGTALTALGWAYIDAGRWDEALEAAAEAAGLAEANQMDIVAASADVITATVLALRGDSAAARRHADRALAAVDPAECGLVAARARRVLGVAALADGSYLQAFTQLRGLFSEDGTPLHNYASYLGVADLAAAAVRADRRMEGHDVLERAFSPLNGIASPRLEQLIARARGILAGPDATAPEAYTALVPVGLDLAVAGALGLAGAAALSAIDAVAPLPGQTLLVSGATGGVGAFAVQLAAAQGAYVIATARPGEDEAYLRDLGAHHTVDFTGDVVSRGGRLAPRRHPRRGPSGRRRPGTGGPACARRPHRFHPGLVG
jgi:tetratricopeptide (TPR) repeat protein